MRLNGSTYARCPDKLHFDVLADRPGASSEMVLVPCNQDFSFGDPDDISVHFTIINEFEQAFSATTQFACFHRATLGAITHSLDRSTLGTDTAHVIVRGTSSPVLGLVIDAVTFGGALGRAGNEPSFEGGRSATIEFP